MRYLVLGVCEFSRCHCQSPSHQIISARLNQTVLQTKVLRLWTDDQQRTKDTNKNKTHQIKHWFGWMVLHLMVLQESQKPAIELRFHDDTQSTNLVLSRGTFFFFFWKTHWYTLTANFNMNPRILAGSCRYPSIQLNGSSVVHKLIQIQIEFRVMWSQWRRAWHGGLCKTSCFEYFRKSPGNFTHNCLWSLHRMVWKKKNLHLKVRYVLHPELLFCSLWSSRVVIFYDFLHGLGATCLADWIITWISRSTDVHIEMAGGCIMEYVWNRQVRPNPSERQNLVWRTQTGTVSKNTTWCYSLHFM